MPPSPVRPWLLAVLVTLGVGQFTGAAPRLDQLQVVGTHNSYHVEPHPSLAALIRARSPGQADSIAYSHRPLTEQLDRLGIRQLELDVYADPDGGLFSRPAGIVAAAARELPPVPAPDPTPLLEPGFKVLHVPDFDFLSVAPLLRQGLRELNAWSTRHPAHVPIFLLLELKQDAAGPEFTRPVPWSGALLRALEAEILEVLPPRRLLRPDDVRGTNATLREAVVDRGWPALAGARGRFVLLLDNTDGLRDLYLAEHPNGNGGLFFTSVAEEHPAAAWFKINDPKSGFETIQRLVRRGFMVRTRADADTREARSVEVSRRELAFASGAQMISTDYPEPNPSLGPYQVRWTNGIVARANPVSFPVAASRPGPPPDLESLALPGFEPHPAAELRLLAGRAVQNHELRRLGEASLDYARLLELDPPRRPTDREQAAILQLAPVLHIVAGEPFPLTDVVAIHHPDRPCVAYHLFWGGTWANAILDQYALPCNFAAKTEWPE